MHGFLRRFALAVLLLASLPAHAGLTLPTFSEEPLEATSFWSLALPLASTLLTLNPGDLVDASEGSSDGSSELSGADSRRLLAAQTDAAAFIASAGDYRTAQLEQALELLRGWPRMGGQDDVQLAWQVLLYPRLYPPRPQ